MCYRYRNLQLYTELGLKIKKVHRMLEFNQFSWLRQYIYISTLRKEPKRKTHSKKNSSN